MKNKLEMGQACLVSDISEAHALTRETNNTHEFLYTDSNGKQMVRCLYVDGADVVSRWKYAVAVPETEKIKIKNKLEIGQACLVSNVSDEVALTGEDANTYQFLYTKSNGKQMVRYIRPDGTDGILSWKYAVAVPETEKIKIKNKLEIGQACLVSNVSDEVALTGEDANTYQFLYTKSNGKQMVRYIRPDGTDGILSWKHVVAVPEREKNNLERGQACLVSDISEQHALTRETNNTYQFLYAKSNGKQMVRAIYADGAERILSWKYVVAVPETDKITMENKLEIGQACLVSNVSDEVALTGEDDNTRQFLFTDSSGYHKVRYIRADGTDGIVSWKHVVAVPAVPQKKETPYTRETFPLGLVWVELESITALVVVVGTAGINLGGGKHISYGDLVGYRHTIDAGKTWRLGFYEEGSKGSKMPTFNQEQLNSIRRRHRFP